MGSCSWFSGFSESMQSPSFKMSAASRAWHSRTTAKTPLAPVRPSRGKQSHASVQSTQARKGRSHCERMRTMPEASEEDWKRRKEHRVAAIDHIKLTIAYQRFKGDPDQGIEREGKSRPKT